MIDDFENPQFFGGCGTSLREDLRIGCSTYGRNEGGTVIHFYQYLFPPYYENFRSVSDEIIVKFNDKTKVPNEF